METNDNFDVAGNVLFHQLNRTHFSQTFCFVLSLIGYHRAVHEIKWELIFREIGWRLKVLIWPEDVLELGYNGFQDCTRTGISTVNRRQLNSHNVLVICCC